MSDLRVNTISASDGTSPVTLTKQSAAKAWYHLDNDYTGTNPNAGQTNGVTVQDSFNITSITDNGTGDFSMAWVNSFDNALYAITQQGQYRDDDTSNEFGFMCGIKGSPTSGNYTFLWRYYPGSSYDPSKWWAIANGDLA
jgi:hypothetical protein